MSQSSPMSKREWRFLAVVVAVFALGLIIAVLNSGLAREHFGWTRYEIEDPDASEAAAEKIILLIDHYKNTTGDYPRTLEELEEYFWVTIEDVPSGYREWDYRYVEGKNFVLRFGENGGFYPCYYYESSTGMWGADH